ncbi:hypothetical protein ACWGIU_18310 [Streptomyces sp. NPDC054840]
MLSTRMGKAVVLVVLGTAVLMAPATAQADATGAPQGAAAPAAQADAEKTDMGWQ